MGLELGLKMTRTSCIYTG